MIGDLASLVMIPLGVWLAHRLLVFGMSTADTTPSLFAWGLLAVVGAIISLVLVVVAGIYLAFRIAGVG